MKKSETLTLMTTERIQRSLKRMAHEINEQNKSNRPLLLFGINQRGFVVAKLLAEMFSDIRVHNTQIKQLILKEGKQKRELLSPKDSENYFIVIVDDVIFSGQTMFQALKVIDDLLKPNEMHTAVLIDRGHRVYPIKAEFYGMELPTKLDEHVAVTTDDDHIQQVQLMHQ